MMFTHEEMVSIQAEKHDLIDAFNFKSREECVLHMMHSAAYLQASKYTDRKQVLDLGCNTGYGTNILSTNAKSVVGVDVSENAIAEANALYGKKIKFLLVDGTSLPFSDGDFDVVVSCQVLEHIINLKQYFNEINRILSGEGVVIFTTPNANIRLYPGMKPWNPFHVKEYQHKELLHLLKKHFDIVSILGLNASERLYSIEYNRVNNARKVAINNGNSKENYFIKFSKSVIKKVFPRFLLTNLKQKLVGAYFKKPDSFVAFDKKQFLKLHSTDEFYYQDTDLDLSLDLMAICKKKQ